MATPLELSELDYIYKKDVASKVKTDSATVPLSSDTETLSTLPIVPSNSVWLQSDVLDQGATVAVSQGVASLQTYVKLVSVHGVGDSQDYPALTGVAWSSGIKNWVNPTYDVTFSPTFYVGPSTGTPPSSGGPFYTIASSIAYPFIFDYQSGILTFLNGVPQIPYPLNDITTGGSPAFKTTYSIWVTAYTYTGTTLASTGSSGITGITGRIYRIYGPYRRDWFYR